MFNNYLSCPHSFRDENPFGWKGEIESIVFREYNVEGCNYNDNDINWRVHQRYDIKFNEAGLISEVTQYWGGKFHQKTIKEYDKAGKLITEYVEYPDRSYIEHSIYDSDGLLIEKTKPSCKQIYRYDKQGKLIQLCFFWGNIWIT